MNYSELSFNGMCDRYAIFDEERIAIEEYFNSLSNDDDKAAFFLWRDRNAVGLGLEQLPFGNYKRADVYAPKDESQIQVAPFYIYDSLEYEHLISAYQKKLEANTVIDADLAESVKEDELSNTLDLIDKKKSERKRLLDRPYKRSELQKEIMILEKFYSYLMSEDEKYSTVSNSNEEMLEVESEPIETKSQGLMKRLIEYGILKFLEQRKLGGKLEKVVNILSGEDVPFRVAFLSELGFIDYLKREYCTTSDVRNNLLGSILGGVPTRRIKGNINVLNPKSEDNRKLYTADQHKENVKDIIMNL